jgi:GNAT superfamily N-acetyltransferase
MLTIRELNTDDEIRAACPIMAELRERVTPETFLGEIRRQQAQGYELIGAFDRGTLVALAGIRRSHTLSRGAHLFVDDLVTAGTSRGAGHGRALMHWLMARASREGLPRIYLDARATARGFYERLGFTFHTSIPCWIDVPAAGADQP